MAFIIQIFVSRTKYEKDGSGFEHKIDKIDKKFLMLVSWLKIRF